MADSSQQHTTTPPLDGLHDRGWHIRAVRRDLAITGILAAIFIPISYFFLDVRIAWFADGLESVKPVANVLTQFADTKFYYVAFITALLATLILDRGPIKKNILFWLAFALLIYITYYSAELDEEFGWLVYIPTIFITWLIYKRRDFVPWALFLLIAIAWSGLIINILKIIFGRFRPSELVEKGHFGLDLFTTGYDNASFPSGHATAAATVFTVLWLMYPSKWLLWGILGITLAFTRIFTLSHYVSDVIAGLWLGAFLTLILHFFFTTRQNIHPYLVLNPPRSMK
ncbi:phosphatase PAP2 family protein [Planctomycetota bacterium]|nr:phosphatase PAP2 family protein [Planctomycetota bacterium]